jgi:putative copper resistance protein D
LYGHEPNQRPSSQPRSKAFHVFLGLALLSTRSLLAPAVYPSLSDQHAAAGLLWASGELMTLVPAAIVLRAWMAADGREAARLDRRLDGIEMS